MFHVEQPLGRSTPIRCSGLHFDVGMPGEKPAPDVAGKADGELRNTPSAAQDLDSKDRFREFWNSDINKKMTGKL